MSSTDPAAVQAAMERLWVQFLPQIEERVGVLEQAAAQMNAGVLGAELREDARSAAHKLAGVLGTFGLHEATALAREAEAVYESTLADNVAQGERMSAVAVALRTMIQSRR